MKQQYNQANGNLMLRFMAPSDKMFRPYAEGLFGFNRFYTQIVIREREAYTHYPYSSLSLPLYMKHV